MEKPGNPERRTPKLSRVLRPLFWWSALVVILFGIHTHLVWIEKTRIYFALTMDGKEERYLISLSDAGDTPFGATAAVDGNPILTDQRIPLGKHTFTITQPKAEPYSTNFFVWYGPHNLGTIDLKRAKGMLTVSADPPAPLLFVRGPEAGVTLTNSSGIKSLVPTDEYTVTAQYDHWQETHSVKVFANTGGDLKIAPRFGVLDLTCGQKEANFQLNRQNGALVQTGDFPALITELPADTYQLVTWHHNHKWMENATVVANMTNSYRIDPQYGTVVLETTPSGATVTTADGGEMGTTPLTLSELQPGAMKFNLQLNNYESVAVSFEIVAKQKVSFHTNLISQSYLSSMRAARQSMNAGAFDDASRFLTDALRAQPDDPAATSLRKEAIGMGSMARAEGMAKQGDYIAGIKELDNALAALPDSEKAKEMLADFKRREPDQIARMRIERANEGKKAFDTLVSSKYSDGSLFETHEIRTRKELKDIELPLLSALTNEPLRLRISKFDDNSQLFGIEAVRDFTMELGTAVGRRQCFIVGSRTKDDDTQILFKVLEYKTDNLPIQATGESEKLQARIAEGISNVTAVIQRVVGTPTNSAVP